MEALYWDDVSEFVAYCKSVGMEVSIKCGRSLLQFASSYTELTREFGTDWKFSMSIKCGRFLLQFASSYTELTREFGTDWKFSIERKPKS